MELLSSVAAWMSGETTAAMESATASVDRGDPAAARRSALSPREHEVAALMTRGYTHRQIAEALSISIATVERHASNILNKLGLHSRSQVAVWAFAPGLTMTESS